MNDKQLEYILKDIREVKNRLNTYLKPYKEDVKRLEHQIETYKDNAKNSTRIIYNLLAIIYYHAPDQFNNAFNIFMPKNSPEKNIEGSMWQIQNKFDKFGPKND